MTPALHVDEAMYKCPSMAIEINLIYQWLEPQSVQRYLALLTNAES